jgi:dTDP-4-amino-4,6-dideoxygalactose transaminase
MGGDEQKLVQEAFATNWIAPLGPQVDAFEKEFAACVGSPHAAALSSGTAAIHLALRMIRLGSSEAALPPQCAPGAPQRRAALATEATKSPPRPHSGHSPTEVFCSSLTFSASANPIAYEGLSPVFIDCERKSWNMDPELLAKALEESAEKGRLPLAVILVHLYGQSADIDPISGLCNKYGVPLIEDAAEALGAVYYGKGASDTTEASSARHRGDEVATEATKSPQCTRSVPPSDSPTDNRPQSDRSDVPSPQRRAELATELASPAPCAHSAPGTRGLFGIYSFNGNKIITTSGGGMLVSPDKGLIERARFLATQARDPSPHYQHSQIGYNYRLSNVLAAIGRGQLHVLPERVNARRAVFARYQAAFADLPGLDFMPEAPWGRCTRWLTCVTIDPSKFGIDREALRQVLAKDNIEARPVWKPMHLQPVFQECRSYLSGVGEDIFTHGLCIPSGSNLSVEEQNRVIRLVRGAVRR